MKRFLIFLVALLPSLMTAQLTFELKGFVNDKISSELPKGATIELKKIEKNKRGEKAILLVNGEEQEINFKQFEKITFQPTNSK